MSAKWLILQATVVAGIELMSVSREGTSRHFSMMNKVSAVDTVNKVSAVDTVNWQLLIGSIERS